MKTYKLKPPYQGKSITQSIRGLQNPITLDDSVAKTSAELEFYYRFSEFHQYIECKDETPKYKGVEHKSK